MTTIIMAHDRVKPVPGVDTAPNRRVRCALATHHSAACWEKPKRTPPYKIGGAALASLFGNAALPRGILGSIVLASIVLAWAGPTAAQITSQPSLLAPTGTNTPLGSDTPALQRIFQSSAPPPATPGQPTLRIAPSLGLQEEYTDNAFLSPNQGKRYDFITLLSPALMLSDEGQRFKVNLNYAPSVYLYAPDGGQNWVSENFTGTALATIIPDLFYVDMRGYASEQAISGGLGQTGATLNQKNTSQDTSFSLSPYLQHRFGEYGTGELGAALGRTDQTSLASVAFPLNSASVNQNVTTYNGHIGFKSGDYFGRFNNALLLSATQFDGDGVLSNAHRDIFTLDNGYALTRNLILLAKLGYENIHYGGTSPVNLQDAIWNIGVRLTPNADSSITVRYGHEDGFNALTLDASYAPTARTRIFARYSSGLATSGEELQNALATSSVDAGGQTVDAQTGAPLLLGSNFFGTQNDLYKLRTLSLTGVLQRARDVISATISNEDQTVISAASVGATGIGSNNGTFGTLSWLRDINPRLSSTVFIEYGTRNSSAPAQSEEQLLTGGASLKYRFNETLVGTLQYNYTHTTSNIYLGTTSQNLVLVNLQKTF